MKSVVRAALVVLGLGMGMQASAANAWRANLTLKSIITNPSGVLLLLEASEPTCGSSGDQFNMWVGTNGVTTDSMKMALSVAMMAMATGRTVSVVADTALSGCPVQQIKIDQ